MFVKFWDPAVLNEKGLLRHNHVLVRMLELRYFINRVLETISHFSYQKQILLLTVDDEQFQFVIERVAGNRLKMQHLHVAFVLHSGCSIVTTFGLLEGTSVALRVQTEHAIMAIRDSLEGSVTNVAPPIDLNLLMTKFLLSINKKQYPETIEQLLEYLNEGSKLFNPDMTYWVAKNYAFYFGSLY